MDASLFKWLFALSLIHSPMRPSALPGLKKHPLYITVTDIAHNDKDKILEVSCKIFTDDFEKTLEAQSHSKLDLSNPADKAAADKLISDYIPKHLQLGVDGKPVLLQYVGFEKETDATWCYFQVSNVVNIKRLNVINTLLYEIYPTEISIMHVSAGGIKKSGKLSSPEKNAQFDF